MGWEIFHGRREGPDEPKRRFVPESEDERAERLALEDKLFRQRIDAICEGLKGDGGTGSGKG